MASLDDREWRPKWVFLDGVGWWPYGDLELDEYEQELETSIARDEWRSAPNFEAKKARYEEIARNTMATWGKEQVVEVERRVAEREAKLHGAGKSRSGLAGDGVTGDNPAESKTA